MEPYSLSQACLLFLREFSISFKNTILKSIILHYELRQAFIFLFGKCFLNTYTYEPEQVVPSRSLHINKGGDSLHGSGVILGVKNLEVNETNSLLL
jgi:hypothetical protein